MDLLAISLQSHHPFGGPGLKSAVHNVGFRNPLKLKDHVKGYVKAVTYCKDVPSHTMHRLCLQVVL